MTETSRHMYCPEDGMEVPHIKDIGGNSFYGPCPECWVWWVYDGGLGVYAVVATFDATLGLWVPAPDRKDITLCTT